MGGNGGPAINVVILLCDTLRADHLGCYGARRPATPFLDRLATEGVRFTQARSPHIPTHPAHATLFSGLDVFAHQVVAHGGSVAPPEGLPWLPDLLAGTGVFTAAVDNLGRWFARGFAHYQSFRLEASPDGFWRKGDAVLAAAAAVVPELGAVARAGRPFFAFFHFWDPHTPYCPPPPLDRMFYQGDERRAGEHGLDAMWAFAPFADYFAGWMPGVTDREFPRAQYAASVRGADQALERLWGLLAHAGCLEDTLVLALGDHGEELGEHGIWFDHHGLYETNLRVPLILWAPGRVPAGGVCGEPVTLLDVAPTVLGALGVPPPEGLTGRDLRQAWGPGLAETGPLYGTECTWQKKRFWLRGRHKLISALEPDFHGGPDLELYDLEIDPQETGNLARIQPALAAQLLGELEAHVARRVTESGRADPLAVQPVASRRIGAPTGPARPGPTEADRERVSRRLANLGY